MTYLISIKNRKCFKSGNKEEARKEYNDYHREYQRQYYTIKYKKLRENVKNLKYLKSIAENWKEFSFDD